MSDSLYGRPFVQVAHRLRWRVGTTNQRAESERPREGRERNWGRFLDDPNASHDAESGPTLVTFPASDRVDVASLLRSGAIREPRPDQLPPPAKRRGKPVAEAVEEESSP